MAGRPSHKPTDTQRAEVSALAGFGVREDEIANYMGIDPKTLRKHYRRELDLGTVRANAAVARSLYRQATEDKSTSAAIFWLKARAGWTERQEYTIEHRNVTTLSDERLEHIAAGGGKRAAAAQGGEDQLH